VKCSFISIPKKRFIDEKAKQNGKVDTGNEIEPRNKFFDQNKLVQQATSLKIINLLYYKFSFTPKKSTRDEFKDKLD